MRTLIGIAKRCLCRMRMRLVTWHLWTLDIRSRLASGSTNASVLDDVERIRRMRVEALAIENARSLFLLQRLRRAERRARVSIASDAYRKQTRTACKKRSTGHSPLFNDSAPKATRR